MACHAGRLLPRRLRQMASKMVLTTAQPLIHVDSPGSLAFLTGWVLRLGVPGVGKRLQCFS